MDLLTLATLLIDTPSVTGSEAAVLEILERICTDMGMPCEREPVTDGRWNLYANWSPSTQVVFCTHCDTVPPFFPARLESGRLSGRGACDTKGIMAAMLSAGSGLLAEGHAPAFLFVVGEETDSIGAKTAAASGRKSKYIVVGEPTENLLVRGHKGVLSYTLETAGTAAHSAYPERGSSATHRLLDIIGDIREASWGEDSQLGPSTLNVGLISGGIAPNVLADRAEATLVHRIVDPFATRVEQLERIVGDRASIRYNAANDPQRMHIVPGFETAAVSFGTDIPYLRAMATPLLFGPGSIHDAHTADESISISAMEAAVTLYQQLHHSLTEA